MLHADVRSATEWAHACSSAFVPLRVHTADASFCASLDQVELGTDVTVTRVTSHASRVVRDRAEITASPREDLLLSVQRRGNGSVSQHHRTARLTPGACALYDASQPYALAFPAHMSELVLQLPRRSVHRSGHAFEACTARVLRPSAALRALTELAAAVSTAPEQRTRPLPSDAAIADSLAALLRASVADHDALAEPPLEAELLAEALAQHLDEHAADPSFTPERLAVAFHVSLRHAQKLFARHIGAGIADRLRHRRLELARSLLASGSRVAEAAHRSGHLDVDSFSRAFKRAYDVSPSQYSR